MKQVKTESDGTFKRAPSAFRNHITKGSMFEPEAGRYHLYASYACREYSHHTLGGIGAVRTKTRSVLKLGRRGL